MNNVFDSTNVDLYHLLGLHPGENNQAVIKKNFSDLIKIFHSDRGGDARFHQQIVEAYRILSDPSKKFIYDNFGLFGVYAIKEDYELLQIFSDVISSTHLTQKEIEVIKDYVKNKIYTKLYENYTNSQQSHFSSADISSSMSTGLLDYFYKSSFEENKKNPVILGRKLSWNKISLDNGFSIYESEDNNKELSVNLNCSTDPKNHEAEISYGLDFSHKIFLPYNITLFEQNFLDNHISIERSHSNSHSDLNFKNSMTIYNFLKLPVNLGITPNYSLFEKVLSGLELSLDYGISNNLSTNLKVDPIHKTYDINLNLKRKKEKIITFLNLGKDRFTLGAFYFRNLSSKFSKSNSVFLKQNGLFCTNESIVHFKHMALKFTSNMNITKSENKFKLNSSLVLALQLGTFKIQFPIVISSENNLLSHSLILLSSLLGNIFLSFRKHLSKKKASEHVKILNKLNKQKHTEFAGKNLQAYYNKNQTEKSINGLIINSAFLGEYTKMLNIYKSLQLFGIYVNDDDTIFDVKIPLTLHMVNSRIDIPIHFFEIEGLYIPDFEHRENLAMVIMYTYNHLKYTIILKNDRSPFSLP
jgi:curved DNA-binding protein CbpA